MKFANELSEIKCRCNKPISEDILKIVNRNMCDQVKQRENYIIPRIDPNKKEKKLASGKCSTCNEKDESKVRNLSCDHILCDNCIEK